MERNANAYYDLLAATVELFNERIQQDELTEDDDWSDALHEVVDGQVPHYYSEISRLWPLMVSATSSTTQDSSQTPRT